MRERHAYRQTGRLSQIQGDSKRDGGGNGRMESETYKVQDKERGMEGCKKTDRQTYRDRERLVALLMKNI